MCHIDVIAIKDVIISKRALEKEEQLVMRDVNKIMLAKVRKTSSLIDHDGKYIWTLNNIDINAARDLRLICIKNTRDLLAKLEKN